MSEKKEKKDDCEHRWKQLGTEHGGSILELACTKCGAKKEIELFPQVIFLTADSDRRYYRRDVPVIEFRF